MNKKIPGTVKSASPNHNVIEFCTPQGQFVRYFVSTRQVSLPPVPQTKGKKINTNFIKIFQKNNEHLKCLLACLFFAVVSFLALQMPKGLV